MGGRSPPVRLLHARTLPETGERRPSDNCEDGFPDPGFLAHFAVQNAALNVDGMSGEHFLNDARDFHLIVFGLLVGLEGELIDGKRISLFLHFLDAVLDVTFCSRADPIHNLYLLSSFEKTVVNGLIDIHFIALTEKARHFFRNTNIPKAAVNMKWTEEMLKFLFEGYQVLGVFSWIGLGDYRSFPHLLAFLILFEIEDPLHPQNGTVIAPLLGDNVLDVLDGNPLLPFQLLRDNPTTRHHVVGLPIRQLHGKLH
jgi:hypothetical protein